MSAYYNEIDPFAAAWLRRLIAAGKIAPGEVDERSIEDVQPDDIAGFRQCHFFAGIGGWSLALRHAGVPDDYPVWTGSCPCQPFSSAGKGKGLSDERHLWPVFARLIKERGPAVVFGEQVSSKAAGPWFDAVQADLEAMGYAFGCVAFPAASVGAPHIRDRAYWVAERDSRLADCNSKGLERRKILWECPDKLSLGQDGVAGRLADGNSDGRNKGRESQPKTGGNGPIGDSAAVDGMPTNGFWGSPDWLLCRDAKWRPVEPGTFPLANGIPNRVGIIRGYGNAIVVPQAKIFIEAALDIEPAQ